MKSALAIWKSRGHRPAGGEYAYRLYMGILLALVSIVPVLRVLWLAVTSPEGMAVLTAPHAPELAGYIAATLWVTALLLGRERGPALLPPFPLYVLAGSGVPRSSVFREPVLRSGLLVTMVTTGGAVLVAGALLSHGAATLPVAAGFVLTGVLAGVITTAAWLTGQALPRTALAIAAALAGLAVACHFVPPLQPFTPWGWVASAYPGTVTSHRPLLCLTALCFASLAAMPWLMNALQITRVVGQAERWRIARVHAVGMDLGAAVTTFRAGPRVGRRLRAVQSANSLAVTYLLRDAVGAMRTPGRLALSLAALSTAGVLLTLATMPDAPVLLLGAAAGITVFAGLGPLTEGLRHVAALAAYPALYGVGDERLLAYHLLFPVLIALVILVIAAGVCAAASGVPPGTAMISGVLLGALTTAARISTAVKGPMPASLRTPVPTPMGDVSVLAKTAWAVDGVLLAALAGVSCAFVLHSWIPGATAAAVIAAVAVMRWRRRRVA